MLEHYDLDGLSSYDLEDIPETTQLVNPEYRAIDSQVRSCNGKLARKKAEFGSLALLDDIDPANVEPYQQEKADLLEAITQLQKALDELKQQRKEIKRHIQFKALPKEEQFKALSARSKSLIDTIKMIAYRSETVLQQMLQEKLKKKDQARQLARAIYQSSADLMPDEENATLTVRLHHQANPVTNQTIEYLCQELNKTETLFPGTQLRLIYKLGTN